MILYRVFPLIFYILLALFCMYIYHVKDALYVILWFLYRLGFLSIEQILFVIYQSIYQSILYLYVYLALSIYLYILSIFLSISTVTAKDHWRRLCTLCVYVPVDVQCKLYRSWEAHMYTLPFSNRSVDAMITRKCKSFRQSAKADCFGSVYQGN